MMNLRYYLLVAALALIVCSFGQRPTFELTFTAVNNNSHIRLDSMKVMNISTAGDTTLHWPDTMLTLNYQVGIGELHHEENGFSIRCLRDIPSE